MTVVPRMTVLSRLEVVCVSVISSNRTLRNTVNSISFVGMELTNAMPMDCGSVIWQIVGNMNSLGELRISFLSKNQNRFAEQ